MYFSRSCKCFLFLLSLFGLPLLSSLCFYRALPLGREGFANEHRFRVLCHVVLENIETNEANV
jgi:hypothetical protein